jgi:hypothetical protein
LDKDLRVYEANLETMKAAVRVLDSLGFRLVGPPSRSGLSIIGSPALVRKVFGEGEPTVPSELIPYVESVKIPSRGEFYQP